MAYSSVVSQTVEHIEISEHLTNFAEKLIQWNLSIKATQDSGLSKEVACHEG